MGCQVSHQEIVTSRKKSACPSVNTTKQMSVKRNNNEVSEEGIQKAIDLSEDEKGIIKRQWKVLSADMKATGTAVFMQIFREQPEIKQQFSYRDVDDENLPSSIELTSHAFRFMQSVGATVENIDDLEVAMTDALLTLGKQHVKFTGFKPLYIQTFYGAILTIWQDILGVQYTPKCADVWCRVIRFIMEKLEEGYYMAVQEEKTTDATPDL